MAIPKRLREAPLSPLRPTATLTAFLEEVVHALVVSWRRNSLSLALVVTTIGTARGQVPPAPPAPLGSWLPSWNFTGTLQGCSGNQGEPFYAVHSSVSNATTTSAILTPPANPTLAPYGYYMLFLVDSAGEVSTAVWTQLL